MQARPPDRRVGDGALDQPHREGSADAGIPLPQGLLDRPSASLGVGIAAEVAVRRVCSANTRSMPATISAAASFRPVRLVPDCGAPVLELRVKPLCVSGRHLLAAKLQILTRGRWPCQRRARRRQRLPSSRRGEWLAALEALMRGLEEL
jgi:hypothetical protein